MQKCKTPQIEMTEGALWGDYGELRYDAFSLFSP